MTDAVAPLRLHASCVAIMGRGLLILGPSGAGKSALALQLIALGADLVADDQTVLEPKGAHLIASAPPALRGLIEARHVGLLNCPAATDVPVHLVADLSQHETDRLPPSRQITLGGVVLDLVHGSTAPHYPSALLCHLRHGRRF